jgi:hypothetical protein
MTDLPPAVVYTANGFTNAEMIKVFLEAAGIPAEIAQESYGHTMGLTVGSLGMADVLVPGDREAEARALLKDFEEGRLENDQELTDENGENGSPNIV